MKIIYFIAAGIFLLSCNGTGNTVVEKKDEAPAPKAKVNLPFKVSYEGTPSIGKSENIVTVMNFNGDFIAGKMDNMSSYLADSVRVVFEDGTELNTVRDSMIASIKKWRESMTGAKQTYIDAVAIDNKDKGHEWVFQKIDETHDYKNGKKEHRIYHEEYRLENGKIRECLQYAQGIPAKK